MLAGDLRAARLEAATPVRRGRELRLRSHGRLLTVVARDLLGLRRQPGLLLSGALLAAPAPPASPGRSATPRCRWRWPSWRWRPCTSASGCGPRACACSATPSAPLSSAAWAWEREAGAHTVLPASLFVLVSLPPAVAVRALVPGSAVGFASLLLWVVGVGALVLAAQWVAAFRGRPPFLAFLPDVGPMVMTLWFARSLVLCAVVGGLLTARAAILGVLGPLRSHPPADGDPVLAVGASRPADRGGRAPGLTNPETTPAPRCRPGSVARGFAAYPRDVRIDVWSDILCPFCHLGRRHLELALEQFEHGDEVGVVWHSFQLDRTAPAVDDTPAIDRVAEKYGVPREQMVAQHERMAVDAAAVGLDFQWGTLRGGNSYDAHRLIHLARALGREDEVTERVMRAWYSEGQSIGDPETLVRARRRGRPRRGRRARPARRRRPRHRRAHRPRARLADRHHLGAHLRARPEVRRQRRPAGRGDAQRHPPGLGPAGHRARAGRRGRWLWWRLLRRRLWVRRRGRGATRRRMPWSRLPRPADPTLALTASPRELTRRDTVARSASGYEDTPRTWKSPPALAAFLPWGSSAGYHHAGCRARS